MRLFDEMPAVCAKTQSGDADDPFAPATHAPAFEPKYSVLPRGVLALDLGTKLGWAVCETDGVVESGSHSCAPRANEKAGTRWSKFRAQLAYLYDRHFFSAIYFEDVKRHGPGQVIAAHVYGGFLAHLEHYAYLHGIELIGVGVGQVKKAWTGSGVAKKADMIACAEAKGFRPTDDNEADALAILSLAITRETAR